MTLLFIKIIFLPLSLGVCLAIAILQWFEKTWNDRIAYAGVDLFGSIFRYWVGQYQFFSCVRLSIPAFSLEWYYHKSPIHITWQLTPGNRHNAYQTDTFVVRYLCGPSCNPSLILSYNMSHYLPIFQPKFWHTFMPQIQIPVELFWFPGEVQK